MSGKRTFGPPKPVHRGYVKPKSALVDHDLYDRLSINGQENIIQTFIVPAKNGKAWELKAGQTCRITLCEGSQVGDVNFWNLHDHRERFYSGKTRQIHQGHLSTYDRLWSCMPYLRPMATVTRDSMSDYGVDEDGCSVHDVIGTRCDPYMHKHINGVMATNSCHQALMEAIKPWRLQEPDIHDVFNIFMCTGIDPKTHEYMIRGSPAEKGDYIEWIAEIDLLVALSVCPQGDVSIVCGEDISDSLCHPMEVSIGQPSVNMLEEWKDKQD